VLTDIRITINNHNNNHELREMYPDVSLGLMDKIVTECLCYHKVLQTDAYLRPQT
jgi:hypothetical protein